MQRPRVLVTGASGMIGRYLYRGLATTNDFELFTTSRGPVDWPRHIRHDLTAPVPLGKFPEPIDHIVHCAAMVDESDCSFQVIEANTRQLFHLLEYWDSVGTGCFLNISSVGVYGLCRKGELLTETTKPAPSTPYGLSKLLGEVMAEATARAPRRCVSLRLGYVLAPEIPARYVLSRIAGQFARNEPVQLINPDTTRFAFIDVADIAAVASRLLLSRLEGVYNLVSDERPTVRDVFGAVRSAFPTSTSEIAEVIRPGEILDENYSIEKLKRSLGGVHFRSFRTSLTEIFSERGGHEIA